MTIPASTCRSDRRGCVARRLPAPLRRIVVNIGMRNAGRMVELAISHGVITVTDPATGEILADQRLDTTREYQYRRPPTNVNDAPGQQ